MKLNIDFKKQGGLVPAIIQDWATGEVRMLGYMNKEAVAATVRDGWVTFWSRSKGRLWQKGEESGNRLKVVSVQADCDNDALLVQVEPAGPTCHTGTASCFDNVVIATPKTMKIEELYDVVKARKAEMPEGSYTAGLFADGLDRIAQKVGEEAVEVVIASKNGDDQAFAGEAADLLYHLLVLLVERGVPLEAVAEILRERAG